MNFMDHDIFLNKEFESLESEKKKSAFTTDIKKIEFADMIKSEIGNDIKKKIENPDRHNPKKQGFWKRLSKVLGF
jgi:hypothetical protein